MIRPIAGLPGSKTIPFTGVKRKDILETVAEDMYKRSELKHYKMEASYAFINGKLEMVASEETSEYLKKRQEYEDWLNEELPEDDDNDGK